MRHFLNRGFTGPELLTVLAIVGLLTGVSVSTLADAMDRYRLRATGQALMSSLERGRATAIRRQREVQVCPSTDGHACSAAADWARGWIGRDRERGTVFDLYDRPDDRIAATRAERYEVRFSRAGISPGYNQRITLCVRGKASTALPWSFPARDSPIASRPRQRRPGPAPPVLRGSAGALDSLSRHQDNTQLPARIAQPVRALDC